MAADEINFLLDPLDVLGGREMKEAQEAKARQMQQMANELRARLPLFLQAREAMLKRGGELLSPYRGAVGTVYGGQYAAPQATSLGLPPELFAPPPPPPAPVVMYTEGRTDPYANHPSPSPEQRIERLQATTRETDARNRQIQEQTNEQLRRQMAAQQQASAASRPQPGGSSRSGSSYRR